MNHYHRIFFKSVRPAAASGSRADEKPRSRRHEWRAWVAALISVLAVAAAAWWHAHEQNIATGGEHSPDAINGLGAAEPLASGSAKTQSSGRFRTPSSRLPNIDRDL